MIKIGICDDDLSFLKAFSKALDLLAKNNQLEININTFSTGKELLEFNKLHKGYFDIIFLDILMDKENGIEVARRIREDNCQAFIIFVTTTKDYALQGYEVDAYKYILKPLCKDTLENILINIVSKIEIRAQNTICVKNNGDLYSINLDKVIYFESDLRKIIAHLQDGQTITFYNKMSDFEKDINSTLFVRVHRSFLVNLMYLKNIVGTDVETTTKEYIPISKKYINSTKVAFTNFIKAKLYEI